MFNADDATLPRHGRAPPAPSDQLRPQAGPPDATAATLWQIAAQDFDGFYSTTVVVAAGSCEQAADLATREAVRLCRERLASFGFMYGISDTQADRDTLIARKAAVFHAEALKVARQIPTQAVVLRAPGYR